MGLTTDLRIREITLTTRSTHRIMEALLVIMEPRYTEESWALAREVCWLTEA